MQFFKRAALLLSGLAASITSSNSTQAQEENWTGFFREDTPSGWLITIEQTTTYGQRGEPKYCAKLDYTFSPNQRSGNGFPNPEVIPMYNELEDKICDELKNIDCRAIATKIGQDKRYAWFCSNEGNLPAEVSRVAKRFTEFQIDVKSATFAELQSLNPTTQEAQIAQNGKLLNSLQENGDLAERPRKIMHWIYGATSLTAENIAKQLETLGYIIEETEGDKIVFSRVGRIDRNEFDNETRKLNGFCAGFGCMYDGWETAVVRK